MNKDVEQLKGILEMLGYTISENPDGKVVATKFQQKITILSENMMGDLEEE